MPNSQQDFENSTQQIKNSARKAHTAANDAVNTGNAAINAAKNAPQNIQNAAQAVKNAPENIKNAAEKTANAVKNAPSNVANAARKTGNAIRQMPVNTVNAAKTMANNVATGVVNAPGAIVNGVKAMPGKAVAAAKKAPSILGHAAKNVASAAAHKVVTTITGAAGFLLLIMILCASIATVESLSSVLGNDEGATIKGFFKTEEQYNDWMENVFYQNFADSDADDNALQFAAVVSAYHYAQTNTSFVSDSYTFDQYLKNFTSGKDRSQILDSVSEDTGYQFSEEDKKKMIDAMTSGVTGGALVDGDASKVTPSGTADGSTFNGGRGTDRYNKAIDAFISAYGKACYDYSGKLQCVSVSEWYLTKIYGCHYAFGNGRDIVRNALSTDPDKLVQLSDWTAGAIFSVQGKYDMYGHTGYVAKVDKAAGMVWLTEAWGSDGTYHENRPWLLNDFYSYYGNAVSFCIGKDYYNQLQQKAKEGQ